VRHASRVWGAEPVATFQGRTQRGSDRTAPVAPADAAAKGAHPLGAPATRLASGSPTPLRHPDARRLARSARYDTPPEPLLLSEGARKRRKISDCTFAIAASRDAHLQSQIGNLKSFRVYGVNHG